MGAGKQAEKWLTVHPMETLFSEKLKFHLRLPEKRCNGPKQAHTHGLLAPLLTDRSLAFGIAAPCC